jgi:predicted  nucleic acid-binding Zn-ribbon protein
MVECIRCQKTYETVPKKCGCGGKIFKWIPEKPVEPKKEKMFKDGLF